MGKKLLEQNGAEMAATLVALAGPIRSFLDDDKFVAAWEECTKEGVRSRAGDILKIYAAMSPHLFGKKHLKDTVAILAAVEGKSVRDMLEENGAELIADALRAWAEQLQPFFTQLGITA